jgi:hypothetical protein
MNYPAAKQRGISPRPPLADSINVTSIYKKLGRKIVGFYCNYMQSGLTAWMLDICIFECAPSLSIIAVI